MHRVCGTEPGCRSSGWPGRSYRQLWRFRGLSSRHGTTTTRSTGVKLPRSHASRPTPRPLPSENVRSADPHVVARIVAAGRHGLQRGRETSGGREAHHRRVRRVRIASPPRHGLDAACVAGELERYPLPDLQAPEIPAIGAVLEKAWLRGNPQRSMYPAKASSVPRPEVRMRRCRESPGAAARVGSSWLHWTRSAGRMDRPLGQSRRPSHVRSGPPRKRAAVDRSLTPNPAPRTAAPAASRPRWPRPPAA